MRSKFDQDLASDFFIKFQPLVFDCVFLLKTNRQTNGSENNTSLVKVIIAHYILITILKITLFILDWQ